MSIFIWTFVAVLFGQAVCSPSLDFGSSNDEGVSEQFLADLKKLVAEGGLTKDDDSVKDMISGLLNLDFNQLSGNDQSGMNEKPPSTSDSIQQPSVGMPALSDAGQHRFRFSLPVSASRQYKMESLEPTSPQVESNPSKDSSTTSNQPETPLLEIKSLAEWVRLDRANGVDRKRRRQTIPSLENVVQGSPADSLDVKDDQAKVAQQVNEGQSLASDPAIGSIHPESLKGIPEASPINPQPESTPMLKIPSEDDHIHGQGYYASSVDWMKPLTDTKETEPAPEENPDGDASFTDSLLSKLSLQYWKNINWGTYLPNPFASSR